MSTAVSGSRAIGLVRSIFDALRLSGPPDGSLAVLTGYAVLGGDILSSATGSAASTQDTAGTRIDGTATSAVFGTQTSWSFVLRRPDAGTPADFGGRWRVTFAGSGLTTIAGDVALELTVPADGNATTSPTTLVSSGTPVLDLAAGSCRVAPAGGISCQLPSSEMYGITMFGAFDRVAGTGGGSFYLGAPPSIFAQGTWSAIRIP